MSHYLKTLGARGVRSIVFVVGVKKGGKPSFDPGLVKLVYCEGGARFLPQNSIRILQAVSSSTVDAVHVVTGSSTLLGSVTVIAGRIFRLPTSISFFGREDFQSTNLLGKVIRLLSEVMATSISTNSKATMGLLPRRLWRKTYVLLGGSEALDSERVDGKTRGSVLFVGRLVKRKGVDDLLRAFVFVSSQVRGERLVVVGDGPERESLGMLARELGLGEAVVFRGALSGSDLGREYASCDLCVLPSKLVFDDPANEGLGLALIEASMYGKPLVGTMHGGIPEVVRDGVNGYLVHENSPKELAAAIIKILQDGELSRRLGGGALRIARTEFTWDAATERLLNSYAGQRR